ncbi:hypothetical protein [Actinomadura sp. 7K534]|uniref:hypothetical protein n=1 Tax=Actinomadura sp. 7K534 TaxID=2530366 RepID=UPI00104CA931|nr:hypothetical protein [Actinomadura sp. 7K534]TDB99277.1 hypothetical protein E1266_00340 [Actinomadura sp. 7K534]
MTAFTQHDADDDPGTGLRVARCRLPGGRAAAGQVRRTVHGALHGWGLGPVAGDLTDHLTALVQEFLARTASRARGPIDLRLELRASARLLLGEIHNAAPEPVPEAPGRGIVALTYGRRPARDGTRYIHSFTWWHQDAATADG